MTICQSEEDDFDDDDDEAANDYSQFTNDNMNSFNIDDVEDQKLHEISKSLIEDDEEPPQPPVRPHGPWQRTPFTSPTSLPSPSIQQPTTVPPAVPPAVAVET